VSPGFVLKDYSSLGPGVTDSQQIGIDAQSTLHANKPLLWDLGAISGSDFGVDFQFTLFDSGGAGGQYYCNVQLKGTTLAKSRIQEGKYLSYGFDRTTLNIWHNSGLAIFVTIADLIDSRDPKEAKIDYLLANPELEVALSGLPPKQQKVTLRVPTSQLVHRHLDILPDVRRYFEEIREAVQILRARKRASGETPPIPGSMERRAADHGANLDVSTAGDSIEILVQSLAGRKDLERALSARTRTRAFRGQGENLGAWSRVRGCSQSAGTLSRGEDGHDTGRYFIS
jgi:hypothetical protein